MLMADESHLTEEDLAVFLQYGMTMYGVQRFEQALKQLAHLYAETPEGASVEQAWRDVRKILTSAAGSLTKQLANHGKVAEELLEDLREVAKVRNALAHEYMLWYVLRKNLDEIDPQEETTMLVRAEEHFLSLHDKLSELSNGLLLERGIDPDEEYLTVEEGREILQEMLAEGETDEAH